MQTKFFTTALALATLTIASGAFASDGWSKSRNSEFDNAPINRPEPRLEPVDYSETQTYKSSDEYRRPVRRQWRYGDDD